MTTFSYCTLKIIIFIRKHFYNEQLTINVLEILDFISQYTYILKIKPTFKDKYFEID